MDARDLAWKYGPWILPYLPWVVVALVAAVVIVRRRLRGVRRMKQAVPAVARVLHVTSHDARDGVSRVELHVRVSPPDRECYETTFECAVPSAAVPQSGGSLPVLFDSQDPQHVILADGAIDEG